MIDTALSAEPMVIQDKWRARESASGARKILIVDDTPANREFLVTTLGYAGHHLIEASNGEEALAQAQAERPDLIIADILMPRVDGYEFVRQLRADPAIASTPVIFHTAAYLEDEARPLAEACGVSFILPKPTSPELLFAIVGQALGESQRPVATQHDNFDREHLRLVTNKLSENSEEKRRAIEALEERACLASLIADVGLALAGNRTLGSMLQQCAEAMVQHLGAAFARIWTLNESENVLELQASAGMYTHRDGAHGRVPVGRFKIGLIAQERRPHLTNAVVGDPRVGDQEWAKKNGMVSFAGYPLLVEDRLIGVIAMFSRSPLSDMALQAIGSMADMLSVGIDRVQTEIALRDREEQFRQLTENISEVFWMTTGDLSKMIYVSPAYEKIWGRSCQSLYEQPSSFLDAICPEDRPAMEAVLQECMGRREFSQEYRIVRPDGSIRSIWNRGFPVRDQQGQIYRMCGVAHDVSELRRTEERLKFTQFTIDHVAAPILWVDTDGRFFEVNEAACQLTGYTREELLKLSVSDVDDNIPREKWGVVWGELRQRGILSLETNLRRKDGTEVPISVRSNLLQTEAREFSCTFLQDIREQKLAEGRQRALAAERDSLLQQLQLQIERMPLAYLLLDADLRAIDWNPAAERIFGYSKQEVLGMGPPFEKIVPDAFRQQAESMFSRTSARDISAHSANDNLTKDGRTISCDWINTPLESPDGRFKGVMCLAQDVSERRRLESQLRQAQKMEAIGNLAGGIAHDFNNLMTVVTGYSQFVLDQIAADSPARSDVEEIKKAGQRAASLTRQLLAFGRRQVLSPELLSLGEVVSNIKEMIRRLIGEHIELVAVQTPELRRVKADPGQIEQILMNLAVNARDAMPNGGKLLIETSNIDLDAVFCDRCRELQPGPHVQLAVSDTGIGMDAALQSKIFEPFFTTKELGKGTGLGLSMVYGIVQQSGGAIRVYSEPGRGATFKMLFPQASEDVKRVAIEDAQHSPTTGSETILLAEDEEMVRIFARRILEANGYTVLEAPDGNEALKRADEHVGPLHLVLTDLIMPKMSGKELAQHLEQRRPGIHVLFMSGYTEKLVSHQGILNPGVALIEKPFTEDALLQRVRTILDNCPSERSATTHMTVREHAAAIPVLEHAEDGRPKS
jgi:two-component system, cell cycle sensor histidine kinase and response regulator CckA